MKIKLWVLLPLLALSFYLGSLSSHSSTAEKQIVVPDTPNYTVRQGDTLSKIAQKLVSERGISSREAIQLLIEVNRQKGNEINALIYPGQDIYLPITEK